MKYDKYLLFRKLYSTQTYFLLADHSINSQMFLHTVYSTLKTDDIKTFGAAPTRTSLT